MVKLFILKIMNLKALNHFHFKKTRPCVFEYIYFARPDSILNGNVLMNIEKILVKNLLKKLNVDADLIVPVPDSGNAAAIGL